MLDQNFIEFGENLIKKLDANHVAVDAALWVYSQEEEVWNLWLSFPRLVRKGSQQAYSEVLKALLAIPGVNKEFSYYLDLVTIAKADDHLLRLIRNEFKTGKGISHIRLTDHFIKGQLVKDVLIYRLL